MKKVSERVMVSERAAQTSDPLESADAVLAAILASSKDCIKILDLEGNLLYLSELAQQALAIRNIKPYLGASWTTFWSGPDLEAAEQAVREARAGRTGSFEGFFATLKGEPRWWDVVVNPIRGHDGHPEKLLSIARDITEHKMASGTTRGAEGLFRALANQIPQICYIADGLGNVLWFNDRWYEYTGLTPEQSLASGWRQTHPDQDDSLMEFVEEANRTPVPFEQVHQIRDREGRLGWFLTRATPVKNEQGEFIQWFGTATDIDDQVSGEEDRKRLVEELRQSNRELSDFAHILSHDLQTHVRTMLTFVQLLVRQCNDKLDADGLELVHGVEHGAQQMHELIRTVLNYSTTSRLPLHPGFTNLNDALSSVLALLGPALREIGTEVTSEPLPEVAADRVLMQQLFQNLISNSIKYRAAERPLRVTISAERHPHEWMMCVSDNGIGIAPKDHERVFAPLMRLHDESIPGTGFGLAVCRRIVERHHGRIWVESELGSGSKFYFTLRATALPGAALA